jgi:hypothetical protein
MFKVGDKFRVDDASELVGVSSYYTTGKIYEVGDVLYDDAYFRPLVNDNGDNLGILGEYDLPFITKIEEEKITQEEIYFSGIRVKEYKTGESVPRGNDTTQSVTGSQRVNKGKVDPTHLTPDFILEMAQVLTANEGKYDKYNYALGQNLSTVNASLMRHLFDVLNGVDVDETDGCNMYAKIAVNAMIGYCTLAYHVDDHPELDDRFKKVLNLKE